ncbi:MAG TPA: methyltransferase domain-containing protein [Jatrophihabitans sp.]|jgi:2-polyprenyl-3-methyl-5-hydroxy-6-metoxy-1,4-benzoquinol methylase
MALSKYDIEAERVRAPGTSHSLMIELVGSNKRVLDIGCDTGYLGEELSAFGNRVSGVEIDPVTAEEAAKHLERVVVADLEGDNPLSRFEAGSFDVVIFGDVLEHLRDPLPTLRAARPLLAPGGSIIISTPNVAHGDIRLGLLKGQFRYTKTGILDETHTRFFTRDSLVDFLRDGGFVLADLRRTHAPLFGTETGLQESDFPADIVATLRTDPEATTYQFVLRAVPDDASTVDAGLALRTDQLQRDLITARAEGAGLADQVRDLSTSLHQANTELAELRPQLGSAHTEREHLRHRVSELEAKLTEMDKQLRTLLGTPAMRAASIPRSAYRGLRRTARSVRDARRERLESRRVLDNSDGSDSQARDEASHTE